MKHTFSIAKAFVEKGYITTSEAERIAKVADTDGVSPAKVLENEKKLTAEQQAKVMADYMGFEFVDFDTLAINRNISMGISPLFMQRHQLVPINIDKDGVMMIAMANPEDFHSITALNCVTSAPKRIVICNPVKIANYITSLSASKNTFLAISDLEAEAQNLNNQDIELLEDDATVNAPAVRLVNYIIDEAIPLRASDIHIEPYENDVRVRYRIDGMLKEKNTFSINFYPPVLARIKILSGINIAERRVPQDGRIEKTIGDVDYDFRVSTLPTAHGEKVVIRILDKNAFSMEIEQLGFAPNELRLINRFLTQPHGIILLTGPTGSGKSTTLYTFLKELNKEEVNIVTVEDPIEYTIAGINQVQVNNKAGLTFASALRSILRQDPNIIMIGEIRDEETAQIATRAAITGHLVFSTLHTNDAPGSITRLLDMKIEPYLLSDALVGVISQRLVRKLCPKCKVPSATGPKIMASFGLDTTQTIYEAHPEGCEYCNHTGYKGRTAVHEVLAVTEPLKAAIAEQRGLDELRDIALNEGLTTLLESAKTLVLDGTTSMSELLSITTK